MLKRRLERRTTVVGWPRAAEPCGDASWRHGHVSDDGEAVEVWLRRVGRRGFRDESSSATNLARGGQMGAAIGDGRTRPYRLGGWEKLQN